MARKSKKAEVAVDEQDGNVAVEEQVAEETNVTENEIVDAETGATDAEVGEALAIVPDFDVEIPPPVRRRKPENLKYASLLKVVADNPGKAAFIAKRSRGAAAALITMLRTTSKRLPELEGTFKFPSRTNKEDGTTSVWAVYEV